MQFNVDSPRLSAIQQMLLTLHDGLGQASDWQNQVVVHEWNSRLDPGERTTIYDVIDGIIHLYLHEGQWQTWNSPARFIAMLAGTQGGKTSFGPWWLWREIMTNGAGDYIAATASYDLFKLKMLPEMRNVFEHVLGIGRYWAGDKIMELCDPQTRQFLGKRSDDPHMWGRIILRSATAEGGLESTTGKAAWLDEAGQDEFRITAWEAVRRRLSLAQGRVLLTTTLYNLGWIKQVLYNPWERGDESIDVIQFDSTINPLFPQAEFDEMQAKMPSWKFNMFYRGRYDRPAGMVFNDFIDAYREDGGHLIRPFAVPQHWPRYVGVDPGAVNHAMLWMAHDTEHDLWYVYREQFGGDKPTAQHAREAKALAASNGEHVVRYTVGQKSEKQQRMDWIAAGVENVAEPPIIDVESGIDKIIELLRLHRIFFFDDLYGLLNDIGTYARKLDKDTQEPTDEIKDKQKFHFVDALRYNVVGALQPATQSFTTSRQTGLYKRRQVPT